MKLPKRLAALAAGSLLSLALLEVGLQVAARVVGGGRGDTEGRALVVCQGDSNVFGLFLPGERSFPGQLEARLPGGERVANRGVPGKTTWIVRSELPGDLERHAPAAYVVMAGTNNLWQPRPADAGDAGATERRGLDALRTVRLARLVLARVGGDEEDAPTAPTADLDGDYFIHPADVEAGEDGVRRVTVVDRTGQTVELEMPAGETDLAEVRAGLEEDLRAIVATCREAGVTPVLCCYAVDAGGQLLVNEAVVAVAEETGAPLVDPRPHFEEALRHQPRMALLYESAHPTDLGYSIVARLVEAALVEGGVLDGPAPADPLELVRTWEKPEFEVEPVREGGAIVAFRARFAPGIGATVLVSHAPGEARVGFGKWMAMKLLGPGEPGGYAVPLAEGDVLRLAVFSKERERLLFDAEGEAVLPVPPLPPPAAGEERWASVLLITPDHEVLEATAPVRLGG